MDMRQRPEEHDVGCGPSTPSIDSHRSPTRRRDLTIALRGAAAVGPLRRALLQDVAQLLMPAGTVRARPPTGASIPPLQSYLAFPSPRTARLLLPVESAPAAAAAVALRAPPHKRSARYVAYRAAGMALRGGLAQRFMSGRVELFGPSGSDVDAPPVSLAQHISGLLGQSVYLAPKIGRADPHRTVGMHIFDAQGQLLAFAKTTGHPLSCAQLSTEAQALRTLPSVRPRVAQFPQLLHQGHWNGLGLLMTSPMDLRHGRQPTLAEPPNIIAMLDVAASGEVLTAPLGSSLYWQRTRERVKRLEHAGAVRPDRLNAAADLVEGVGAVGWAVPLRFGAWHGDWLPWNMARISGRLLIWDWEYWSDAAPVGFDMFHFVAGTLFFREGLTADAALDAARRRVTPLLEAAGFPPAEVALVYALYTVEFLVRRLDIAAHGGGRDDARVFPSILPVAFDALSRAAEALRRSA